MSDDDETRDEPQPQDDDDEGGRITTLADLNAKVDRLAEQVQKFFAGGGTAGGRPRSGQAAEADERRAEIRDELASLRKQEKAEADQAALASRVRKIERTFEAPPKELRRVEKAMRWE